MVKNNFSNKRAHESSIILTESNLNSEIPHQQPIRTEQQDWLSHFKSGAKTVYRQIWILCGYWKGFVLRGGKKTDK